MCFDGALRLVLFWALDLVQKALVALLFVVSWPVWSWSFSCARFNSVLKPICILRVTYLVCYASWRDLSETKKA